MSITSELTEVRLQQVPLALRGRSLQHGDELVREMTLIAQSQSGQEGEGHAVPRRLVALANEVRTTWGAFTAAPDEQFAAALERGDEVITEVIYRVPPTVATFARHLIEVLVEADIYCRTGKHLLTLATPADIVAYRRWVLTEFQRQTAGEPPVPWPEFTGA